MVNHRNDNHNHHKIKFQDMLMDLEDSSLLLFIIFILYRIE